MTIKIDEGIPAPCDRGSIAKKYPFDDMEIGDSFVVEPADGVSASSMANRLKHKQFTRLPLVEDGVMVIRFWRVA